ncbi:hypothetical protein L207DRAFT_306462 [Hyaloscypha variabilis F]|uniref:Oxidoreductase acuF-like C2H2 type zinc-finger domain-containing protein n=1 Tax=Hyaloscypha variabilis (strain UAMH 11265 / GT02V1 / F) TaxID=1149755 RepID=A0A2J6RUK4_HYAVF|nr:hypothetical protein L207DRAFT_306462 [Hyaloscypha variabilis F]
MHPNGKSGKVVEWIDGATIHRSGDGEEDGAASGFAWTLYDLDLRILTKLIPMFSNGWHRVSRKDVRSLKQSLGDLFLWGDGFRDGRLEKVVEESDDLEETLVSSLIGIGRRLVSIIDAPIESIILPREEFRNLVEELKIILEKASTLRQNSLDSEGISGGETTDDDAHEARDRFQIFIYSLKIHTTCLMDLLPSMEDTLSLARQVKDGDQPSLPFEFHVSGPARTYILNIYDRFPKADSQLVERLGEANWQRHTALRGLSIQEDSSNLPVEEPVKSVFVPVSLFQDSGIGSSLPAQPSYAPTSASHTSFVSSQADGDGGGLLVPPTPKAVFKGIPFSCETCGQMLSQIKNRIDWKRHVFADLKPYLCTFSDCKDALRTFPTRKMWETHEFEEHRFDTVLCCSLCPSSLTSSFLTEEEGNEHLKSAHGRGLEKKAPGIPLGLYKQRKPHEAASISCPLCLCVPGTSRRNFVTHVSKHIESIALAALPRENGSDSESGSDARSVTTGSSDHASDYGQEYGRVPDSDAAELNVNRAQSPVGTPVSGTMDPASMPGQQNTTLQPLITPVPLGQIGRVEAPPPPAPGKPAHIPPAPPAWLTQSLVDLLTQYPHDRFEGVMRYGAVNTATDLPCAAPPAGQPAPEGVKYMYLPRIRCLDCPGKLYLPGPETTAGNFVAHLNNRGHRAKVDGR